MLLGKSSLRLAAARPSDVLPPLGITWQSYSEHTAPIQVASTGRIHLASYGRSVRSRVCPHCLESDPEPYIRAAWEMPMSIHCEKHDVYFLDQCLQCGRDITLTRRWLDRCDCGALFSKQRPASLEGWVWQLRNVFSEAYSADRTETFALASPDSQKAARACKWLAAPVDSRRSKRAAYIKDRRAFLTLQTATAIRPIFEGWPERAVAAVVMEVNEPGSDRYARLAERLGVRHFSKMRELMAIVRSRTSVQIQCRSNPQKFSKTSYGIKDLIRVTGHSYVALLRCIDEDGIPGARYNVDSSNGMKRFSIPIESFETIRTLYQETVDIEGAASCAGCTEDSMRGLVRSNSIESKRLLKTRMGDAGERLYPRDIEAFCAELFRLAHSCHGSSVDRVYFSWWIPPPFALRRARRWRNILSAVRSGRLPLFTATPNPTALNDLFGISADLCDVLNDRTRSNKA